MRRLAALLMMSCLALPASAQHLRIGLSSDPDVLDPTLSRTVTGRQVFAAMCDKLVDINERLEIVPQLATAWRWADDGKALVFTLREGVRFQDGEPLTGESHHKGYFVAPTIFDRVDRKSRIAQEEIFGPVLSVIRVADFEEGLEVCNDTRYGLTSSVYTQDASRVFRFVRGIETGITHVNSPTMGGEAQLPFGGTKATGVGMREMGKTAIDFYSEWKTVYIDYTGKKREALFY